MAYILILLSLLALAGAVVLLLADSRERSADAAEGSAPAPEAAAAAPEERGEEVAPDPEPEPEAEPEPEPEPAPAPETAPELEPEPEPERESQPEPELESEPEPDPAPEAQPGGVTLRRWEPPTGEERAPRPHRRSGLQLPGSSRRERRAWAEAHGFDFARQDEFLNGEWTRGAAASGAAAKDIASGVMYGHEVLVMDLGGVTVMAMRTGEVSDVVVDLRRRGFSAASSADLVEVGEVEDFTVYATEAGPAQRFLDVRVRTALEQLPAAATAVWFESEWVLAETEHGTTPAEWDEMLAPLALLADAARVLPPHAWHPVEQPYPTREMGEGLGVAGGVEKREEAAPKVQRPEEPLEMPTRTTGAVRGVISHRAVGGDEVEPIAEGGSRDTAGGDLTRVRRDQTPPSIFGD